MSATMLIYQNTNLMFLDRILILSRKLTAVAVLMLATHFVSSTVVAQDNDEPAEDPVAIFNQAQDLHEKGDLAGAIKLYDKAIELTESFPEAQYQKGTAYLSLNKLEDAEASFRKAIDDKKDWSLALAMLGETLVRRFLAVSANDGINSDKLRNEATAILRQAIELDPNSFPAYSALADLQINGGSPKAELGNTLASVRAVTDGKMKLPSSIWTTRAALENALGDRKQARVSVRNALSDKKNTAALRMAAELAIYERDDEQARAFTEMLVRLQPDDPKTYFIRAKLAAAESRFAEALDLLAQIKVPLRQADELRQSLTAVTKRGKAELENLLVDDPKNIAGLAGLCKLYRLDSPDKALEYCRRAAEAEPDNVDHSIGFGAALVQMKQYDAAASLLIKIKALLPENASVRSNLAGALYQLKRYSEARDEYRWIADKFPERPIAYFLLAVSHDQLGEFVDAMANYQQFLKLADPKVNQLEIEKVQLRLPSLEKQIKEIKKK